MRHRAGLLLLTGVVAAGGCNTHFEAKEPQAVDHTESRWYEDASGEQPYRSDEARGMKMEWEAQPK
jgi:hypothetical protein